jgi:hypothetical protein
MTNATAIVIVGIAIAAAIAVSHRFQIAAVTLAPDYVAAWRLDNWTGAMLYCDKGVVAGVGCAPVQIRK